jgi:hypothetical protein
MLFESALSYVIDIFKDETVKAVTEEQTKAIFSVLSGRDTFVCLQTTDLCQQGNFKVTKACKFHMSRGFHCVNDG